MARDWKSLAETAKRPQALGELPQPLSCIHRACCGILPSVYIIRRLSRLSTHPQDALALLLIQEGQLIVESSPRGAHALGLKNAAVESDLVRPENPPYVYLLLQASG